jgi:hypothetical protein
MVASGLRLMIEAPGTGFTSSAPTTPTLKPSAGGRTLTVFTVTVVLLDALPHPAHIPAQSAASAMSAALIRISPK